MADYNRRISARTVGSKFQFVFESTDKFDSLSISFELNSELLLGNFHAESITGDTEGSSETAKLDVEWTKATTNESTSLKNVSNNKAVSSDYNGSAPTKADFAVKIGRLALKRAIQGSNCKVEIEYSGLVLQKRFVLRCSGQGLSDLDVLETGL
jgi:hypothetical protein